MAFQVCWLLINGDGQENGYVDGRWGGQILWEAEVLEDLYRTKAEYDLSKTQNSQINNEQNLSQVVASPLSTSTVTVFHNQYTQSHKSQFPLCVRAV